MCYTNSITMGLSTPGSLGTVDGQASDQVPVLSGVPKGTVLLILFLISNDDLPYNIKSSVRRLLCPFIHSRLSYFAGRS